MIRSVVAITILASACGGSKTKAPEGAKQPLAWKQMDAKQRETYMKDVVLPKAKAVFVAFDPKYQTMDCKTCHGDGADDGSYEMPNAKIKPLPNTEEAFIAWVTKEPVEGKYAQFMAEKVEPLMGELLQTPVFDPKTKTGEIGCSTCHTLIDANGQIVKPEHHHHDHDHHD